MFTFHAPTAQDIAHVAARMRSEDAREVMASHGHTPLQALAYAITASDEAWSARWNREPVLIFGFSRVSPDLASVWLLGTPALTVSPARRAFLTIARNVVERGVQRYGRLFNLVDARAITSRRWLRWMGFTEQPPIPYGPFSLPFIPVEKSRCVHPPFRLPWQASVP